MKTYICVPMIALRRPNALSPPCDAAACGVCVHGDGGDGGRVHIHICI